MFRLHATIFDLLFPRHPDDERLAHVTPHTLSAHLRLRYLDADNATLVLFPYKNTLVKSLIISLKYRRNTAVAGVFAAVLHDVIAEELSDRQVFGTYSQPLFIPLPLSRRRLRRRGFNQTALIARKLAKIDNGRSFQLAENILRRRAEAKSQTATKSREEREGNVTGAFFVKKPERVRGRNVILFDDVITTGSTAGAARSALHTAGARNIITVALAH